MNTYIYSGIKKRSGQNDFLDFVEATQKKNEVNYDETTNQHSMRPVVESAKPEFVPHETEVMSHLKDTEGKLILLSRYDVFSRSKNDWITEDAKSNKAILWMIVKSKTHKFLDKTVLLAVYLFRKFENRLTTVACPCHKTLAAACLFISMKFEEIYPPHPSFIIEDVGNIYNYGQLFNIVLFSTILPRPKI